MLLVRQYELHEGRVMQLFIRCGPESNGPSANSKGGVKIAGSVSTA